jgi:transketolase
MRKTFGQWIAKKAQEDKDIYLIVGDIGYGIFDDFREKFPDRFINVGICEQTMIGIAAGMALSGLKPYVYTITPFLIERPFEQIKDDIDCNNINVKLIGYDDYPEQGPTHSIYKLEELMKHFPNIESYYPKNSKETILILDNIYNKNCPCFMKLRRDASG